ncbi:acetyltransferase [Campylobacter iguaniorum]|uniref:[Ribosomal protein bS18]-alanine N-acetyltransferase n=1 Tax=Campylobacter iguaniorum TaxID=1244531 RepID=A0A076F9A2_9BACT|nr:ribosomal protein S18-alanine N-acetyltransferase [Campylobacter iguaniorum]AII14072.1 acetyltransferase [Campylobacter iguaniorum]
MLNLQQANLSDISELCELENSVFDEFNFPLSKANFRYHIQKNYLIKAVYDEQIWGYILVLIKFKVPRIYSLAVSNKARGKGVGKALIQKVCDDFVRLRLEVRADNQNAISLYEKFGFKTQKIIKNYYPDSCDALEMTKAQDAF